MASINIRHRFLRIYNTVSGPNYVDFHNNNVFSSIKEPFLSETCLIPVLRSKWRKFS